MEPDESGVVPLYGMQHDSDGVILRIVAPHFTAGLVVGGKIAPIIKYMKGWSEQQIREYCFWKGWKVDKCEGGVWKVDS